ncbi:MAG TPA: hypothetical protein VHE60_03645 [Pyrinomonadaceae bacterium]|nr:hypothetical protein [Pyrinomonadaceae bacterium]
MLKRTAGMVLVSLWAITSVGVAQVPTSVLLNNVREPANSVSREMTYEEAMSGEKTDFGNHTDSVARDSLQCLQAIDRALAGGVPDSKTIELEFGWRRKESKTLSLADIRTMCQRASGSAGKEDALKKATQAAIQASGWPKELAKGPLSEPDARVAADVARECVLAIDEALAKNNPGSTKIQLLGDEKMTLSEAREMCVYVLGESDKQAKANKAAAEAEFEPFRKVLSGDKLSIYNDHLKSYKLYGAGGRVLGTPEDYRASPLWCNSGVNRDGIVPMWEVSCWHFRGMTQVGEVVTRNGEGENPPSSAYR